MPTPVYAQAVITGDNPSVTVTQAPSDYTWNITLVTTPATSGSGTFIVMSGVRIIGSGTLGATIGPFTAYGDEQIKLQVTGAGIAGSTVAITGLAYARGETVPPVSPIPASATNIISGSVNITAGTITLANGSTVGISGGQLTNTTGTPVQPTTDQLTSGDLGTGSDGTITLTANTTLARDMQYSALTVNVGVTLSTAGYVIRCQNTLTNNGTVACNGGAATSTAGGLGAPTGTLYGGADGAFSSAVGAVNGKSPINADVEGGAGGNATAGAYNATGGTVTVSGAIGLSLAGLRSLRYSGGASGGMALNQTANAAAGGGAGVIIIFCGSTSGNGVIQANGGAPYNGGTIYIAVAGSGGGIAYVATRTRGDSWTIQANGSAAAIVGTNTAQPGFPGRTGILVCNGS